MWQGANLSRIYLNKYSTSILWKPILKNWEHLKEKNKEFVQKDVRRPIKIHIHSYQTLCTTTFQLMFYVDAAFFFSKPIENRMSYITSYITDLDLLNKLNRTKQTIFNNQMTYKFRQPNNVDTNHTLKKSLSILTRFLRDVIRLTGLVWIEINSFKPSNNST